MEENQLIKHDALQMVPLEQAKNWYNEFVSFSKSIMKPDIDFGIIPGTPKPSLYKAGAEKLRFAYGLSTEFECIDKTVDIDRPFIDYTYRCTVSKNGNILAQCEGSCNSMEAKYGYVWKSIHELPQGTDINSLQSRTTGKKMTEFDFAINKRETTGAYGKPAEYWDRWQAAINNRTANRILKKSSKGTELPAWELDESVTVYRVTNPDVVGNKNTIMKMAQKRAFVGAVLIATGASEFFTQDVEDMEIAGRIHSNEKPVDVDAEVISTETKPAEPVDKKAVKQKLQKVIDDASATPAESQGKFIIPGHWYAKLEKCKAPGDVTLLYEKNKETVDKHPELQQLFKKTQKDLKAAIAAAKEKEAAQ